MRHLHYILVGEEIKAVDMMEWANWFETAENRSIAKTEINGVGISTVFLGIDHNFNHVGPPLLFETVIFDGDQDGFTDRYFTLKEAREGHEKAVKLVRGELHDLADLVILSEKEQ